MRYDFEEISRHSHEPNSVEYIKIRQILNDLYKRNLLERFDGECIAAADILQHSLANAGISSKIIECQLSIINNSHKNGFVWRFVGFDDNLSANGIDTHAVIVTNTEEPWLIDISLPLTIGGSRPWVVEKLNGRDSLIFSKFQIDDLTLTYHPKLNPRLLGLHQKTLLDRIKSQKKIERTLTFLKGMVVILFIISTANFTRGAYDFYQKYIIEDNNFGPNKIEKNNIGVDIAK